MRQRGQITLFVILGMVLMFVFAFMLFTTGQMNSAKLQKKTTKITADLVATTAIENYVTLCLEKVGKDALRKIGEGGGKLYNTTGGPIDFSTNLESIEYLSKTLPSVSNPSVNDVYNISYGIRIPDYDPGTDPMKKIRFGFYTYPSPTLPSTLTSSQFYNDPKSNPADTVSFDKFFGRGTLSRLCLDDGPNDVVLLGATYGVRCTSYLLSGKTGSDAQSFQQQIQNYSAVQLSKCVDLKAILASEAFRGYEVRQEGSVEVNMTLGENDVEFAAAYPITIDVPGESPEKTDLVFRTRLPVRLLKLHQFMESLISYDIVDPQFNIKEMVSLDTAHPKPFTSPDPSFKVEKFHDVRFGDLSVPNPQVQFDDIVRVTDEKSLIDGKKYFIQFATKNRKPILDLIRDGNGHRGADGKEYDFIIQQDNELKISPKGYDPDEEQVPLVFRYKGWRQDYTEKFNYDHWSMKSRCKPTPSIQPECVPTLAPGTPCCPKQCRPSVSDQQNLACYQDKIDAVPAPQSWEGREPYKTAKRDAWVYVTRDDLGPHNFVVEVTDESGEKDWQNISVFVFDKPVYLQSQYNQFGPTAPSCSATPTYSSTVSYDFAADLQGWTEEIIASNDVNPSSGVAGAGGRPHGINDLGNPAKSVIFDSCTADDDKPRMVLSRDVRLPLSAQKISYDTRAQPTSDGVLLLGIKGATDTVPQYIFGTPFNECMIGATWIKREFDIPSRYVGQQVTLSFKHLSCSRYPPNNDCNGEHRWLDNVCIKDSTGKCLDRATLEGGGTTSCPPVGIEKWASTEDLYTLSAAGTAIFTSPTTQFEWIVKKSSGATVGTFTPVAGEKSIRIQPDPVDISTIKTKQFTEKGKHTVEFYVTESGSGKQKIDPDTIIDVKDCIPFTEPSSPWSYPYHNTALDPFKSTHGCCTRAGFYESTLKECFRKEEYGCAPDVRKIYNHFSNPLTEKSDKTLRPITESDSTSIFSFSPSSLSVAMQNDLFKRVYRQMCSGTRGNVCSGQVIDTWTPVTPGCKDFESPGQTERCQGPAVGAKPAVGVMCTGLSSSSTCYNYKHGESFEKTYQGKSGADGVCNENFKISDLKNGKYNVPNSPYVCNALCNGVGSCDKVGTSVSRCFCSDSKFEPCAAGVTTDCDTFGDIRGTSECDDSKDFAWTDPNICLGECRPTTDSTGCKFESRGVSPCPSKTDTFCKTANPMYSKDRCYSDISCTGLGLRFTMKDLCLSAGVHDFGRNGEEGPSSESGTLTKFCWWGTPSCDAAGKCAMNVRGCIPVDTGDCEANGEVLPTPAGEWCVFGESCSVPDPNTRAGTIQEKPMNPACPAGKSYKCTSSGWVCQ